MPSEHDQCLFLHKEKKILLLLCVDDCMLFCEDDNLLQEIIKDLKKKFALSEQALEKMCLLTLELS